MISLHFENLRLFIPQYVAATLISIFIYVYLGRKYPGWKNTIPFIRKAYRVGHSSSASPINYSTSGLFFFPFNVSIFNKNYVNCMKQSNPVFDLLYYYSNNRLPDIVIRNLSTTYVKPPFYESAILFQIYRIMLPVSAWAGLMLVITPFSYISVFIPHFPNPYNIIIAIVLSISIFEGILSTIFFRIGVSWGRIVLVEGSIIVIFTLSLLSPSMSWLALFNLQSRLIIYLVLLFLFTVIAALISQLRTMKNLFLSSIIFSTISYFSFVVIVLYNVIGIVVS